MQQVHFLYSVFVILITPWSIENITEVLFAAWKSNFYSTVWRKHGKVHYRETTIFFIFLSFLYFMLSIKSQKGVQYPWFFRRRPRQKQFIKAHILEKSPIFRFVTHWCILKCSLQISKQNAVISSLEFYIHGIYVLSLQEIYLATHDKIVLSYCTYICPLFDIHQSVNDIFPSIPELHVLGYPSCLRYLASWQCCVD